MKCRMDVFVDVYLFVKQMYCFLGVGGAIAGAKEDGAAGAVVHPCAVPP